MTTFFLILAIFIAVWSGVVLLGLTFYKQAVPAMNIIFFALSVTAIITHFIGIW